MATNLRADAGPGFVEAEINHIVRGEKAVFWATDRSKSYWPVDPRTVRIADVRPIADQLSFDRNGFLLCTRPSGVRDFYDAEEVQRVYIPEVTDLVLEVTGAEKVLTFGTMIRSDGTRTVDGSLPSYGAHVDYGARTVADMTRQMLGDEADRWLERRHMLINLWRPIRTVERTPLALCDASTVTADDLFDSEVRGGLGDPNRPSLWGYNLAYNPAQRWYYAPLMTPDEVFVFKLFDSDASHTQWTAHSAFSDPTSPADAPPRESIELRTISFMPE